ncbi:hypothetical protein KGA66_00705 [Actinocrinis puniceicyclus]|uniref:Uncharacterized protein n=1 Tax=Actinocrinis puniceicyclus TaxID=977794 RepID=A0A8J7WL82_9ACTN|nr:hypothetical protein [Actinocrinis puniceicyclus]MBS2961545.1 hypothetical protein [Actinocrinis puniceicyclus]
MQRSRVGRPSAVSLSVIIRSLIAGPILLALGVRGLLDGPQWWLRTVLWIWCVAGGSVMTLLGLALLAARRARGAQGPTGRGPRK